ncbi:hypothetical protein C8R44DRAFT_890267 [Mycena epipterygia]|nr:hypothetical protein C8R44DRAFT_890267 [Mycena epipterygia]
MALDLNTDPFTPALDWVHRDSTNKNAYYDDDETVALAEEMLAKYAADGKDPLDDISSFDIRRMNALCLISAAMARLDDERLAAKRQARVEWLAPWPHMRASMGQVATQIVEFSAAKRATERQEVGPAPVGFSYVQLGDQIYLAADDGDGSLIYMVEADAVILAIMSEPHAASATLSHEKADINRSAVYLAIDAQFRLQAKPVTAHMYPTGLGVDGQWQAKIHEDIKDDVGKEPNLDGID